MTKLQIGQVTKIDSVTIIPVEQLTIYSGTGSPESWWYGSKEMYALVISTSSGLRAIDQNAHELDIADLIDKVPALNEHLHPKQTSP